MSVLSGAVQRRGGFSLLVIPNPIFGKKNRRKCSRKPMPKQLGVFRCSGRFKAQHLPLDRSRVLHSTACASSQAAACTRLPQRPSGMQCTALLFCPIQLLQRKVML